MDWINGLKLVGLLRKEMMYMQKGIILDAEDVKNIIAKYFGVDPKNVIKSQYSYTVIGTDGNKKTE